MAINLKNNTEEIINLVDIGIVIPPNEAYVIDTKEKKYEIATSDNLIKLISDQKIIVNDDINNLSPTDGVRAISTDVILTGPKDRSGKIRVQQTSRKLGTMTCFTGAGDDPNNLRVVGSGEECMFRHNIGDDLTAIKYIDFNMIENETWLHEGYMTWQDGDFDQIDVEIVTRVTSIVPGTNTFYNLYNGYLIVPAAGDGTYEVTSDITDPNGGLVRMPLTDLGEQPTAFWNADWNPTTMKYENISAAPNGDGKYNLFAGEIPLNRIFTKMPLLDSGFVELRTSDTSELGHGMRMKIVYNTNTSGIGDHRWGIAFAFVLHRKYTTVVPG